MRGLDPRIHVLKADPRHRVGLFFHRQLIEDEAHDTQSARTAALCLSAGALHAAGCGALCSARRRALSAAAISRAQIPARSARPAGNPDGGQWTEDGGFPTDISAQRQSGSGSKPPLKITVRPRPGMGHNNGPALEDPPEIPPERPPTPQVRTSFMMAAALWLGRAVLVGLAGAIYLAKLTATAWLKASVPLITSYYNPPKTLRELQDAVSTPERGYDIHHIVEQSAARDYGFLRSQIESSDNLVRIPRLKHWEITGWYAKPAREFGGKSPREYLQDKGWEERRRVGLYALRKFGVLAP